MNASIKVMLAILLLPLVALPSQAQYLSPVAVRALDAGDTAPMVSRKIPAAAMADTLPGARRAISPLGTIVGGVVGGVAGTLLGTRIAEHTSRGCQGELCGLGDYLIGIALGESIGLAVGSHLGSRSSHPERLVLTTLSSVGILAGGVVAAATLNRASGAGILVPLVPALQLVAAFAIESF